MAIKRIVANIAAQDIEAVRAFYVALFELDVVMEFDWISTLANGNTAPVQLSIASEGGSGTSLPGLSIEVEDVDALYTRAKELGMSVEYELTDEPWGVRRFYLRDPAGTLLNILSHGAG
ncbi:MAG: VOC family protein [Planktotalea sp.]|uniref:VOC family protein n=1 Tax=Planktotalea sp. TaxID=2029877 RepID=UPI003C70DD87